jgi:hypothetical protein
LKKLSPLSFEIRLPLFFDHLFLGNMALNLLFLFVRGHSGECVCFFQFRIQV